MTYGASGDRPVIGAPSATVVGEVASGSRVVVAPTFDRMDALRFEGAWDVGMARRLVDHFGLHRLIPRQDLLQAPRPEIRVASDPDGSCLVVYAPYADEITLSLTALPRDSQRWDLARRRVAEPDLVLRDSQLVIGLPDEPTDSLIILWPEERHAPPKSGDPRWRP